MFCSWYRYVCFSPGGRSRVHPPPTSEYHGHKSGYVGGLGGQRNNSRAAGGGVEAEVGHDHRWRVCGVGVGRQPVSVFPTCMLLGVDVRDKTCVPGVGGELALGEAFFGMHLN